MTSEYGRYIYGIINSDKELFFPSCKSVTEKEVYTITCHDISAVISDSEIVDYNHMSKNNVARYLLNHQMVIEKVMEDFTIIPVQLGTYAVDNDDVRHILRSGYKVIKNMFIELEGMIEIDVVVTWLDFKEALKEAAEDKEIRGLKQVLMNKKEGVTVNDQMKIGSLIKNYLDKRREGLTDMIEASLTQACRRYMSHSLMNEEMVFNGAFLIDKTMMGDFEKRMEDLNYKFDEKLKFRCVGPLPAYSFNTIEVKKIKFADIASAKEKLGLAAISGRKEIEKSYRQQAQLYHPDKNSSGPVLNEQFDRLTKAYRTLLEYSDAVECVFGNGESAGDMIIVVRQAHCRGEARD